MSNLNDPSKQKKYTTVMSDSLDCFSDHSLKNNEHTNTLTVSIYPMFTF